MAQINNPRKKFQFSISILGINPFLCQDVKIPDVELDADEHGDTGYMVKTAGMVKYGMLSITKITDAIGLDRFIWDRVNLIRDTVSGGGAIPDVYKINILIEQFAPDGATVVMAWQCQGCWPRRINGIELSRVQTGNTIEQVEFEVDRMFA